MEKFSSSSVSFLLLLLPLLASCNQRQAYIVYLGEHNGEKALHEIEDTHYSYLLSVKENDDNARASLLYSYKHSINGFAALLTPEEASKLSEREEVVSVFPSQQREYSLHTTRSWEFVGLDEAAGLSNVTNPKGDTLSKAKYGEGVIVGLLDSGVWPESDSFSDEGLGPVPKSWKGVCQSGTAFNSTHCNRKIIGARYYIKGFEHKYGPLNETEDYRSPRDKDGHGSHTASTAAGRIVPNVSSLGGFARGTASGGAPSARLAIYKVCWAVPNQTKARGNTCFDVDMLAALDDAIGDGVDILSISIGHNDPLSYNQDFIAIGALHAIKKNIVVACSAGNSGPTPSTLANTAPWIITVGASSLDRELVAPVNLGNGISIPGQTVTPYKMPNQFYPLVYAADVANPGGSEDLAEQCLPGSLSPEKTKGKIVLCVRGEGMRVEKGMEVRRAGGAGLILGNHPTNGDEIVCDPHVLPATAVSYDDARQIFNYIRSSNNSTAHIVMARTVMHTEPAPYMAAFSSRGPNVIDPNILKPDITAPGLNILAAWSEANPPTKLQDEDHRVVKYNFESGTSMSCPHIAGTATLLRAIHPTWSTAAIRSALITTAGIRSKQGVPITDANGGKDATPFAYGGGHFRPAKAVDPGLVYNATYEDYLLYYCSKVVNGSDPTLVKCPKSIPHKSLDLNYPSLQISRLNGTVTFKRTVTNVGFEKSVYFFSARPPLGYSIKASPSILLFNHLGQRKSFLITVETRKGILNKDDKDKYAFGWYTWKDGFHVVRSPVAISSV